MSKEQSRTFLQENKKLDRLARKSLTGLHPEIWRIPKVDIASATEQKVLKEGGPSRVAQIKCSDGANFVLKHYSPTRRFDFRDAIGYSKATRSHLAAEAILRRGFRAIQPLASWSVPGQGSFMLLEDLASYPRLQDYVGKSCETARDKCLSQIGIWTRQLHHAGIWYRDLKPSNILVAEDQNSDPSFILLDHDRNIFLSRIVSKRFAIQDIASILAGLPDFLSDNERINFLQSYAKDIDEVTFWEQWMPLVEQRADRHRAKRKKPALPRIVKP